MLGRARRRWLRAWLTLSLLTLPTGSWSQQFEEVHARAGLEWVPSDQVPEIMTAAWVDIDNDGHLDLWTSPHVLAFEGTKTVPVVYRKQGNGPFERYGTDRLFPSGYGDCGDLHQVSFGDYNNDGLPDAFLNSGGLAGRGEPTGRSLLRNNRTHFTPVAEHYKLSPLVGSGRGALWFDSNRDGKLDLLSINAIVNDTTGKHFSQLFEQASDSFIDRTEASELRIGVSANFAVYSHLFGDTVPCIVIMGGERKASDELFHGLLARVFRHTVPKLEDVTARFPKVLEGRDASIADFTNDAIPDIFIVNNAFAGTRYLNWASVPPSERDRYASVPTFLQYDPATARYVDRTAQAGFTEKIFGSTVLAGDFDNDTFVDLWVFQQLDQLVLPAILYRNNGDGTFVKIPGADGAAYQIRSEVALSYDQQRGIAAAVADYDNDGFLDIYTAVMPRVPIRGPLASASPSEMNHTGNIAVPPQLFRNRGNANHWLELDLVGTISARDAIGTTVILTAGGRPQFRERNSGNHRTGQDMQRLHFGLGADKTVDRIEIRWPSGVIQTLGPVESDQILRVVEDATQR